MTACAMATNPTVANKRSDDTRSGCVAPVVCILAIVLSGQMMGCGWPVRQEYEEYRLARERAVINWDTRDRSTVLSGFTSPANPAMAISPDGRLLVVAVGRSSSVVNFGDMWVLDLRAGKTVFRDTLGGPMKSVCFSGDGRFLAVAGVGIGLVYDTENWQRTGTYTSYVHQPGQLGILEGGRIVIVAGTASIEAMSVKEKRSRTLMSHASDAPGSSVMCGPGNRIVAATVGSTFNVWDVSTWKHRALELPESESRVYVKKRLLCFSPDGDIAVVGAGDRVFLIDAGEAKLLRTTKCGSPVLAAAFSANGRHLHVLALEPSSVAVLAFDAATGRALSTTKIVSKDQVNSLYGLPAAILGGGGSVAAVAGDASTVVVHVSPQIRQGNWGQSPIIPPGRADSHRKCKGTDKQEDIGIELR